MKWEKRKSQLQCLPATVWNNCDRGAERKWREGVKEGHMHGRKEEGVQRSFGLLEESAGNGW